MFSNFQIFTDFDGTVALNDVGDQLFQSFGDVLEQFKIIEKILGEVVISQRSYIFK